MMADYYLVHHGIKGQKWGIRRYQNEDGTLTEEGRKRYYQDFETNRQKMFDSWGKTGGQDGGNRGEQMKKKHRENLDEVIRRSVTPEIKSRLDTANAEYRNRQNELNRSFFKSKPLAELSRAQRERAEAGRDYSASVINGAEQYIRTLPKDQQDIGRSYVYQYLGYDW